MNRCRGFTLIEMIVAFAILSISLTVLYGSFESSLSRVRHDEHLSEATSIARSLLDRTGTEWPLSQLTPMTRSGSGGAFRYELRAEAPNTLPGAARPTLPTLKVSALVTWDESAGPRTLTLATLKLAPVQR
jgi:general secretion pathway protein I